MILYVFYMILFDFHVILYVFYMILYVLYLILYAFSVILHVFLYVFLYGVLYDCMWFLYDLSSALLLSLSLLSLIWGWGSFFKCPVFLTINVFFSLNFNSFSDFRCTTIFSNVLRFFEY